MAVSRDLLERLGDRIGRLGWVRPHAAESLPAILDRRRIYVLPTGFGLFIAGLLAALLLGALNYNNNPGLILGFLLVAAAHNSLVHGHLLLSGLRLTSIHAEPVHAGSMMNVRLRFENPSTRPRLGLQLLAGDTARRVEVTAHGNSEIEIPLPAHQRGWLPIGRLRLSTVRPLGLARAWSWLRPDTKLLVYPALEANTPPLPEAPGDGDSVRTRNDGEQPHHLRDYRPGDAPRQIAWKASARLDRLLVKVYEASAARELVLDWFELRALDHEARIRRLARWVVEAERAGSHYTLRLPGESLGPGQGPEHRHACLRRLALMPTAAEVRHG